MALIKCKNCGKEISDKSIECVYCKTKIREDSVKPVKNNRTVKNNSNIGGTIIFIVIVFITAFNIINHSSNSKGNDMPTGCYRALNKNGGLSDFKLCIYSDSVVYNYLELDKALDSHERTEKLYPRWLSTSRTIQILDNYDDYWFDCVFDKEDSNSMKCKGWGKGGFSLGSYSTWKKQ